MQKPSKPMPADKAARATNSGQSPEKNLVDHRRDHQGRARSGEYDAPTNTALVELLG